MSDLFQRLRRGKLGHWAVVYLAGAWVFFQGIEVMAEPWNFSAGLQRAFHLVVAIGFLVTLVLAWYHAEKGRQRVSGVEILIIVALVAVGALLLRHYRPTAETPPASQPPETVPDDTAGDVRSLAVLPLANLSGDPEQEYFVDGLHDVLIGELAGIAGLKVISRTSVLRYRDGGESMAQIANELGVEALVEGSVYRFGDTVRISVQLVRGSPEEHLWQDRYEGSLSEALNLQTRVAEAIAREIRLTLSPQDVERLARRTEVNPAAQEAYMRGRALWRTRLLDRFPRARAYLEEAVALDSTFALAWAGLADAHTIGALYSRLRIVPVDAQELGVEAEYRRGREYALRALELDPDLAEAHAALAAAAFYGYQDVETAERELRLALELNPSLAQAYNWMGEVLLARGRAEEAVESFRMARNLDPFSPLMNRDYGRSLRYAGRCGEALEAARTAVELDPTHWVTYDVIQNCNWAAGRFEEAVEAVARWFEMGGLEDAVAPLRQAWETGRSRGVLEFKADLFRINGRHYLAAAAYAELGLLDDAFDELFAAIDAKDPRALELKVDPPLEPLRGDPRWDDVVQRAGL
jgi:TolB-like protein/Tfp pilus assembly protein PilF